MPSSSRFKLLLRRFRAGRISAAVIEEFVRQLPYRDLRFAKVDLHRSLRRRFPEVIYGRGKTPRQIASIAQALREAGAQVLVTKVSPATAKKVRQHLPQLRYFPEAGILSDAVSSLSGRGRGGVLVLSAGTSDFRIAEEAAVTLEALGFKAERLFDVGVAGLHRLLKHLPKIQKASVIVVAAGMDGVLPSVVSGLTHCPVVAVPTSIGYGASFRGVAPLLTMLNSCSPGVAVVNIDNGFGAGYLAALIAGRNKK
ncbi:MAG: nickel pincer cofactor biosynthesis protein LarB [Candidatus Omnitrophota bacterium]|nr:nickel pincer cofactor biosynthesis protein LarB [Candidatus Omnitrophota bacterium]